MLKEMLPVVGSLQFSKDGLAGVDAGKTHDWLTDGWTHVEKEDITKIVVMQFTGLHDKNGKEIYEGDLILLYGQQD